MTIPICLFLIYFVIINLLGFSACGVDKKRAIKKKWRISERSLLLIGVIGGCFGLGVGMLFFRHKTNHLKFKIVVPLECCIWIAVLAYLFLT